MTKIVKKMNFIACKGSANQNSRTITHTHASNGPKLGISITSITLDCLGTVKLENMAVLGPNLPKLAQKTRKLGEIWPKFAKKPW